MCGIVGISFRRDVSFRAGEMTNIKKMFTSMLVSAQVRGSAASGVIAVGFDGDRKKPKVFILRSPLPAAEFVTTTEYKAFLDKLDNSTLSLIGHTRAPSGGGASAADNRNNHPFVCGPVIGVHNGRIINDDAIWKVLSPVTKPKSTCDSEALVALIDFYHEKSGNMEDAIASAITTASGWMSLAIVNAKEPNKLYLFRDENSPLELAFWPWVGVAIFASEYAYIEKAIGTPNTTREIRRLSLEPMQLVTLDSTLRGKDYSQLFYSSRRLQGDAQARAEAVANNRSSYETTQGFKV